MARIILIILIILLTILIIWTVVSTRMSFQNEKEPSKTPPLSEKYATAKEKYIDEVMTGSYQVPGHTLAYKVRFGFDDGTETRITVSEEVFEQIPIDSREVLLTQGDLFLDFGGRFGVPLSDDDAGDNSLKS